MPPSKKQRRSLKAKTASFARWIVKFEEKRFFLFNPLCQRNSLPGVHPCVSVHVEQGTNVRMELAVIIFMTELGVVINNINRGTPWGKRVLSSSLYVIVHVM
jgi:hypothetical protein